VMLTDECDDPRVTEEPVIDRDEHYRFAGPDREHDPCPRSGWDSLA
jgi:hypothetical protein